ncbi:uncharacterized protein LY89DRAFT_788376 [Mollisia scopiformis]|uniref:Uncharacterized protein n=1 Tax=Mollisia scopiformis TaxID=149040 RepID=A0A132B960_MOLSC|nr:uncharacterized protein LY89DRAFT_788376 [Mollisia scopiformis]KUJ08942.1 hypothetical protein LY89DRAFT_788376 [Mollisia scopiformis]
MPTRPWRIPLPPTRLQNSSESPTSPASPLSPPSSTSPRSPKGPLTAPPRLHLRTIIPSPPLPVEYLKTAPSAPYPWIWRCHLCGSIYRLGATRRCLEDGHYFCSLPSPPPSPAVPTSEDFFSVLHSSEPSSKTGKEIIADLAANKKRSKSRRRKGTRGCRSEFDYAGWSKYNIWRREVAVLKREQKKKFLTRSLAEGLREGIATREKAERSWKGRDCWKDCDFPSECHNERKAEREWERQMKEIRESEERWARENEWNEEGDAGRPDSAMGLGGEDLLLESIELDGLEDKKAPGDISEEVVDGTENLGPLGTDCDGLGEQVVQAEYTTKRRKSMDAAMASDSPPSSPLKECSFGFENPATRCQVWSSAGLCSCAKNGEEEEYSKDEDGDVQIKEVSMAKSLLLRKAEKDVADETFGDEDVEVL